MGLGVKIFLHSVWLVFNHVREALRISAILYLLPFAVIFVVVGIILLTVGPTGSSGAGWSYLAIPPFLLMAAFAYIWMAVGWHRYVLIDELPRSVFPHFRGGRILAYLGRSMLLGLIVYVIYSALGIVVSWSAVATGSIIILFGSFLILTTIVLIIFYKFSPILPAAAIGKKLSIGDAWLATNGATGAVIVAAVLSAIASCALDLPIYLGMYLPNFAFAGILLVIWMVITGWLKLMVGISVLTTIYGHYVEKRLIS